MAERRTFSMDGAMRLLTARRMWMASPAFWPRIRSITRRAFCGEVRRYRASALACIVRLLRQFRRLLRGTRGSSARRASRSRCGRLGAVTLEYPGGRKFAQLVAHHVFGDVHRDELL